MIKVHLDLLEPLLKLWWFEVSGKDIEGWKTLQHNAKVLASQRLSLTMKELGL